MIFACSLIELYQLGGWYLNANHGEIGYIYMTNNYNFKFDVNVEFLHNNLDNDMDLHTSLSWFKHIWINFALLASN